MSTVPRYLKQLPTPIRVLLRPWLLVALGLHGAVLFLPLLPDEPEPEPELISLTELPPTIAPPPSPQLPLKVPPTPAPPATRPTPAVVARPPVTVPPAVPAPAPSAPVVVASPTPSVTPSAQPTPSVLPSPEPSSEPSPALPDYLANFPHAATTQACDQVEQCWRSPDSQWRGLARTLEADLAAQGYTLTEMPLDDETGRRIYEVAKQGAVTYYLNVISTLQGTVYRVTEQPLTSEEMDAIAGF